MTKRFVVTAGRYGRHRSHPYEGFQAAGLVALTFCALYYTPLPRGDGQKREALQSRRQKHHRAGDGITARETASPPGSSPSEWDGDAAAPGGYLLCCARKALLKSTSPTPSWWGAEGGWGSLGSTPPFPACYRKYQNLCRVFLPPHRKT